MSTPITPPPTTASSPTPQPPSPSPPLIGLIISSTRQPRVCPQIASFLSALYTTWSLTHPSAPPLIPIDLASLSLPFSTEPLIPSLITSPTQYTHPTTRNWSALISSYSAFIFLTPQYNHGYPAPLKNAIDYLFHEWKGKAAVVVSYGGHGGGKARGQLEQVLRAVGMRVLGGEEGGVELMFPDRGVVGRAVRGEDIGVEGIWEGEREGIYRAFEGLVGMMEKQGGEKVVKNGTGEA